MFEFGLVLWDVSSWVVVFWGHFPVKLPAKETTHGVYHTLDDTLPLCWANTSYIQLSIRNTFQLQSMSLCVNFSLLFVYIADRLLRCLYCCYSSSSYTCTEGHVLLAMLQDLKWEDNACYTPWFHMSLNVHVDLLFAAEKIYFGLLLCICVCSALLLLLYCSSAHSDATLLQTLAAIDSISSAYTCSLCV